ncbi:MAG: type I DNA topoisomerase [Clostridia bacterium]|nr:type I DNA topoisomerase [Clostridia bacterium]
MQKLVIVESPTKAPTIKGYLGSGYKVVASKGHVRDLPKSTLGIDIDNNFEAHYINIRGKGDLIKELKKAVKAADKVFLATDPDREGEAISWHLVNALGIDAKKVNRVTFNELTKNAVKDAIKHPREIDMNLVNSQQARRLLDRIVGYKLSPFLWKTVRSGLSAGRVQSVATRIIVERENEIRAFVPKEYWTVEADLITSEAKSFTAKFFGLVSDSSKMELNTKADAECVLAEAQTNPFVVSDVKKGKKFKHPAPPFITSTLQQEASRKLNFQSQRTMKVAQELYEGINLGSEFGGVQGLITYMRTDSLRIADEARAAARDYIVGAFGEKYYPEIPRTYKTKSTAQDAHEAIRPSHINIEPKSIKSKLTSDQYRLYKLIWDRFIASQMESAELSTVQIDITCGKYLYRSSGYTVKFPGFMAVYEESTDDAEKEKSTRLPQINEGETLSVKEIRPEQHYTEPPARYTEASLIKFLEEKGIGRPSTYTATITLIVSRGYVKRQGKTLHPTPLGEVITKIMCERFPDIVDYRFTAQMEDKLDSIEEGNTEMNTVLCDFYAGFSRELDAAFATVSKDDIEIPVEETDIICDKCGARMIVKEGRFGKFAACPNYPECKNTKPMTRDGKEKPEVKAESTGMKCELCGADMVLRQGRYGSFYACSAYPKCSFTKQIAKNLGVKCPDCGGEVVIKYGRNRTQFYSCEKYPECNFSSWDMPTNEKCPLCGDMLMHKKGKPILVCRSEKCSFRKDVPSDKDMEK